MCMCVCVQAVKVDCKKKKKLKKQTDSPIISPTNFPTQPPIRAPTANPVLPPTIAPSLNPVTRPSNAPVLPPSIAPTVELELNVSNDDSPLGIIMGIVATITICGLIGGGYWRYKKKKSGKGIVGEGTDAKNKSGLQMFEKKMDDLFVCVCVFVFVFIFIFLFFFVFFWL